MIPKDRIYHIWNTPGLLDDDKKEPMSDNLIDVMLGQKAQFESLSLEVVKQLLSERQGLRDRNHAEIMGEVTNVSSAISCCGNLSQYDPDVQKRKLNLEKMKQDLEKRILEEDVNLWRDTEALRQILLENKKRHESGQLRSKLLSSTNDGDKDKENTMGSG